MFTQQISLKSRYWLKFIGQYELVGSNYFSYIISKYLMLTLYIPLPWKKLNINNKSYTVILYGDLNADAKIGLADLVQLKKYILGYNNLNSDKLKAADVNKDGKVTLTDLVLMKKKILKISEINQ